MSINMRRYEHQSDYERVHAFLTDTYQHGMKRDNWLPQRWEYMHYHPGLDRESLHRIGVFEDDGLIVAVAHYEDKPGVAFFEVRAGYEYLKPDMLEYAESMLSSTTAEGMKQLVVVVNDFDHQLEEILSERGYIRDNEPSEWESQYAIPEPFPAIELPEGFTLKSLADEYDLAKVHRVMWRGFNHPGEPPEHGIRWRKLKLSAPTLRPDLTIVTVAPNGDFSSLAGTWYDCTHRFAFVEPVATDPAYRRLGLGTAAVLEGTRRCKSLGATRAYVGSGQKFYEAIGFRKTFASYPWTKQWA